jgi:preprotein translocase subunit SecA
MLRQEILSDAQIAYQKRTESIGEHAMRELERRVVLSVIDRRWRDHLYEMDYLKDGIGLRAMAQRDPLVEYQREGFALFQSMMAQIREEAVGFLFNLEVEVTGGGTNASASIVAARGLVANAAPVDRLSYSAPSSDASGAVEVRNQRGQVQQAETSRARQSAAQLNPAFGRPPGAAGNASQEQQQTGAFGQKTGGPAAAPPVNRAQRRSKGKKG